MSHDAVVAVDDAPKEAQVAYVQSEGLVLRRDGAPVLKSVAELVAPERCR